MRGSLLLLVSAVLGGGCRTILGIEEATVAGDAPIVLSDSDSAIDASSCFGVDPYELCPPPGLVLMPAFVFDQPKMIDTDGVACTFVQPTATVAWCVLAAASITVNAKVSATGLRPLVLLATGTFTITTGGSLDVASRLASGGTQLRVVGAGASGNLCTAAGSGEANTGGGGGGAGGSFGTRGGNGGTGTGSLSLGGTAGSPLMNRPTTLRGGCRGGSGGAGAGSGSVAPNDGGGAVYLLAGNRLEISGSITASGSGGAGGLTPKGGGEGGGSGGMIVLWSPTISVLASGTIYANGGGAGGGADTGVGGNPGLEPGSVAAAPGGGGGGGGGPGNGGRGSSGAMGGEIGGNDTTGAGGGGGGGGGGVIRVISGQSMQGANVSPPPSN